MDSHLEKLQQALSEAIAGLSAEDLGRRFPGKWSAEEVLEHLYLTYTGTIKGFSRVLEAGKPLAAPRPTFGQGLALLVVLGFRHMPNGRKAPRVAEPRGLPAEKVRAEILAKIAEMDAAIVCCERELGGGKLLGKALLDHPTLGPLTGKQWRKFHLVHGMHHLKQIRRLRLAIRA